MSAVTGGEAIRVEFTTFSRTNYTLYRLEIGGQWYTYRQGSQLWLGNDLEAAQGMLNALDAQDPTIGTTQEIVTGKH